MTLEEAIMHLVHRDYDDGDINYIVQAISINELEVIRCPLWEKAKTAKYALEADTYMKVIDTINNRIEFHKENVL